MAEGENGHDVKQAEVDAADVEQDLAELDLTDKKKKKKKVDRTAEIEAMDATESLDLALTKKKKKKKKERTLDELEGEGDDNAPGDATASGASRSCFVPHSISLSGLA